MLNFIVELSLNVEENQNAAEKTKDLEKETKKSQGMIYEVNDNFVIYDLRVVFDWLTRLLI